MSRAPSPRPGREGRAEVDSVIAIGGHVALADNVGMFSCSHMFEDVPDVAENKIVRISVSGDTAALTKCR